MKEKNVKMQMKDVTTDPQAKEELRVMGGLMIVPCLMIDGQPLYDDNAIIQWIGDHLQCLQPI